MNKIILKGIPQSTNNLYKSTCRNGYPTVYMTADGKAMKESYKWQAKVQWKKKMLESDVELDIKLYFQDKRKRDWDNYHKIAMDALEGIVIENDSQIQKVVVEKFIDKDNPRIEIYVK